MSHRDARLTVHGRRILVERVLSGRPVAHVAAEMGISRPTAHKWIRRWRAKGEAGLHDRSSKPRTTPHRTPPAVEAQVCRLRTDRKPAHTWSTPPPAAASRPSCAVTHDTGCPQLGPHALHAGPVEQGAVGLTSDFRWNDHGTVPRLDHLFS
ncbi:helix-turn-helix domain-containing protein [Streptomyces sp. NPDC086783]|uniref:helix-turn-helix domain-containing protein n=1 Tax=Streptomyces sp. NPDC086783 TaxID=3365758 RepID=UPI00382D9B42